MLCAGSTGSVKSTAFLFLCANICGIGRDEGGLPALAVALALLHRLFTKQFPAGVGEHHFGSFCDRRECDFDSLGGLPVAPGMKAEGHARGRLPREHAAPNVLLA